MADYVQIFVDIGQEIAGNCTSLSEILSDIINKKSDENIRTLPCLIEVADDTFNVYSSNADFTFDVSECKVRYTKLNKRRDFKGIINECFNGNERYISNNRILNAAPVVTTLSYLFITLLEDGTGAFAESIQKLSNGHMDYAKNTEGKYRFWYRLNGDEWRRGSFGMFTNHLCNISLPPRRFDLTDEYLISKVELTHMGYNIMMALICSKYMS